MKRYIMVVFILVLITSSLLPIFSGGSNEESITKIELTQQDYSNKKIRIAIQYGMQYAPVYITQKLGLLEEALPGIQLEWSNFGGGSAMNEALISGKLDVAFMGIPPVLIAIDKGVEYRIANGICVPPAELLVRVDSEIKSLSDIQPNHKIAVPGVGSIQHIMLAMAAKKQLGSGNALDNNIVAMANPDAYASLISKTDIVGHFASMPYIDLEAKAGMVSVLDAKDALGSGASIVCVTTPQFENEKELSLALKNALSHAIDLINLRDDRVIEIIASTEKISKEAARMYLDWPGTVYALEVYSISALGSFMEGAGYLKHPYPGFNKVTWQGAKEASFD